MILTSVGISYAQDYGTYTGTMDEIRMNDKEYSAQTGQSFVLSSTTLTGTVSKIGSMPGTISLNIAISIDSDGNITAKAGDRCGQLTVLGMIPISLTLKSLEGSVYGSTLDFTLECTGKFGSTQYVSHIHFTGNR